MPTDPMYSPYLEFNPTFKWGGRRWSAGDRDAFMKYLRKRGRSYGQWARRHPNAAKVFDPVENQLYSYFQPELTGIEAERKRTADAFARRMANLGGFWGAIAPLLGGIAPAIGGAYGQGADTMQAAGTGYGNVLNATSAADAAAANQILTSIGAPAGQSLQGGDAGGVLAGLAGWIPSMMMGEQGAAYAQAASQLPKTASLQAQIMAKDLMGQAGEADREFSQAVLSVLQEIPGFRQKLGEQRAGMNLDRQKLKLAQLKEEHDWLKDQAALALAAGDNKLAQRYFELARQREQRYQMEARGLDPDGNPKPGYYEDANGNIVKQGYRYNAKGELVKIPTGKGKGGSTSSTVPGTPAYNAAQVKAVGKARKDVDAYISKNLKTKVPGSYPAEYTFVPYAEALQRLLDVYGYLGTTPTAKKRLRAMLVSALRAAGFSGAPTGPD